MWCSAGEYPRAFLFTLYANDVPSIIEHGRSYLYADDPAIAVYFRPSEIECKLNSALTFLANWFANNKLSLNLKKCKYMLFGAMNQLNNIGEISQLQKYLY